MKNIKQFCKDHKKKLLIGVGIGVAALGALALGHTIGKSIVNFSGKNVISWKPGNKFLSLESIKEFLDSNADTTGAFAIFREGPNPKDYVLILLDTVSPAK